MDEWRPWIAGGTYLITFVIAMFIIAPAMCRAVWMSEGPPKTGMSKVLQMAGMACLYIGAVVLSALGSGLVANFVTGFVIGGLFTPG